MGIPSERLATDAPQLDPGAVLRRSLLGWGLGHLALGDPRGWPLLVLEILWLLVLVASLGLLPTDRWLLAYALLAGFIVVWVAQAVAAYRLARRLSGRDTGAAWLLAVAPVVIALLSGFWLFAGAQSSPASTFERYVGAWRHADSAGAADLFAQPPEPGSLLNRWHVQAALIEARIRTLAAAAGGFVLDTDEPQSNLRFDLHEGSPAEAVPGEEPVQFDIDVVQLVSVPTTFFGLVPASRTETRIVESLGAVSLVRRAIAGPLAVTGASVWVIDRIRLAGEP